MIFYHVPINSRFGLLVNIKGLSLIMDDKYDEYDLRVALGGTIYSAKLSKSDKIEDYVVSDLIYAIKENINELGLELVREGNSKWLEKYPDSIYGNLIVKVLDSMEDNTFEQLENLAKENDEWFRRIRE